MHTIPPSRPVPSTGPGRADEPSELSRTLDAWMREAPWLALSAAAHLLLFLVLAAFPWELVRRPPDVRVQAQLEQPPEDPFVPDEPVEVVPPPDDPPVPDPRSTDLAEALAADAFAPGPERAAELLPADAAPAETMDALPLLGLGGGPSGAKYGLRPGGDGEPGSHPVVGRALAWLAAHQAESGAWDADGFYARCGALGAGACDGAGSPVHDVGVTGLALLALLGDGHTTERGAHRESVRRAARWLMEQQDPDTGLIGDRASHEFLYDHAIATLALCEVCYFSRSPLRSAAAQKAVDFAVRARNPYGAWRYAVPPNGESDTSVTGWMVLALTSARDAGLTVDPAALDGALAWIDAMTDPATGRVGYVERGSASSRTPANARFPVDRAEAMTAVGLLCRVFLGQEPETEPRIAQHAALLRARPPVWDEDGLGCDMYAWYYGSYAMFQLGGEDWRVWRRALERTVAGSQRQDGDARGSWDPVGPWGGAGGRVYSTALMALCAQASYRYGRLLRPR